MKENIKLIIVFILGIIISVVISTFTYIKIRPDKEMKYTDKKELKSTSDPDYINGVYSSSSTISSNLSTLKGDFDSGVIKVVTFSATIGQTRGSSVNITATAQTGYTFLSWIHCHTEGWVGAVYPAQVAATTALFNATNNSNASGTGTVKCEALYRKNK